jgi:hypothetical protein
MATNRWRKCPPAVQFFSLMIMSFMTLFTMLADAGILFVFASWAIAEV